VLFRLPILKNTDHRSNCPNSQNAIGFAIYSIRMGDDWHFIDRKGAPASVRVSGNLVTNSGETVRTAALQGVGISLAAGFLVAEDLEQGRLVRLLPQYRPVEFSMNAVYPHRHHLSAKVRSFIDLLMHHSVEHQRPIDPFS
jgi:DNA-binding transcriptional LysR family regulator